MKSYDAVILGGGLVGSLTALQLKKRGLRCALIERRQLFAGASGCNAGGLYFQLATQAGLSGPLERGLFSQLGPLLKASRSAWQRLCHQHPQGAFEFPGGMILASREADVLALQSKYQLERELGIETFHLDQRTLRLRCQLYSKNMRAASYCPSEGYWLPQDLARRITDQLIRSGITILQGRSFINVVKDNDFLVDLDDGQELRGRNLVGALGASMGALLDQLAIPHGIQGFAIQMARTQSTTARVPFFTRYAGGRLSLKKIRGHVYIGGGWPARSSFHDGGSGEIHPHVGHLQQNISLALQLLPELGEARFDRCWGERVAWTSDGLPIIGASQQIPGLLLACGGNGFTLAPLKAEIIAALILDEYREDHPPLAAFSIDRFRDHPQSSASPVTSREEFSSQGASMSDYRGVRLKDIGMQTELGTYSAAVLPTHSTLVPD